MLDEIKDSVVSGLDQSFVKFVKEAKRLSKTMNLSSYADMGDPSNRDALLKLEELIGTEFSHKISLQKSWSVLAKDRDLARIIFDTVSQYSLWGGVVGEPESVMSTIDLKTFPLYHHTPFAYPGKVRDFAFKALQLPPKDKKHAQQLVAKAKQRIACRSAIIQSLLDYAGITADQKPTIRQRHKLARGLIPSIPIDGKYIDLVVTNTMLFLCLPSLDLMRAENQRGQLTSSELIEIESFLKSLRPVSFEQFSQFPGLSRFEGRSADWELLVDLSSQHDLGMGSFCELLSGVVMIETTDSIEKFMIHDSWGHLWQADLTGLKQLYDRMVALQLPLSADTQLVIDHDNVITLVDLFYVRDGDVVVWPDLAERYGNKLIEEKIKTIFAPLVAEMCADMIEYRFSQMTAHLGDLLPSSSVFSHRTTKLDFAWVDLFYFSKMLKNADANYANDSELLDNLVDRILHIHRIRHKSVWKDAHANHLLVDSFKDAVRDFLRDYLAKQTFELSADLNVVFKKGKPVINSYFKIYINLLRIQATLNHLFHDILEKKRPHLLPYRECFILFIAKYFCHDPLKNFFSLDETIAKVGIPFLEGLYQADQK